MTTFDKREEGYEAQFAHDEETRFKIHARRDRLMGQWVAEQLGLKGASAEAYVGDLIDAELKDPTGGELLRKIKVDLDKQNIHLSEHRLQRRLQELEAEARQQIIGK